VELVLTWPTEHVEDRVVDVGQAERMIEYLLLTWEWALDISARLLPVLVMHELHVSMGVEVQATRMARMLVVVDLELDASRPLPTKQVIAYLTY
jgi:hypothetical protein